MIRSSFLSTKPNNDSNVGFAAAIETSEKSFNPIELILYGNETRPREDEAVWVDYASAKEVGIPGHPIQKSRISPRHVTSLTTEHAQLVSD